MPFPRRRYGAVVVTDMKTLEIEHVYVRMSMRAAMKEFLRSLRPNLDVSYDDMRDEFADALDRYQFTEVDRVTIRRA